jgi:putative protein-disulfide isomerase
MINRNIMRSGWWLFGLLLIVVACHSPKNQTNMKKNNSNPLLCDVETGMCEMPSAQSGEEGSSENNSARAIKILYFTDPICSSCWGIEPALRKLKLEYGAYLEIEYRMGGLLPSWEVYNSGGISGPSDVAHHWDEVSGYYDMPIDGDVWLEDPLPSSYPPSIAFKAAQMQDPAKALTFLRTLKEMVFIEKKNITKWEHLTAAATLAGLDTATLRRDYDSEAPQKFREDLALARQMGVRGFPTLFFIGQDGTQTVQYGVKPYRNFEEIILKIIPEAKKKSIDPLPEKLLLHYPSLTARELAELSGTTKEKATATLNELARKGVVSVATCKNGSVWRKK